MATQMTCKGKYTGYKSHLVLHRWSGMCAWWKMKVSFPIDKSLSVFELFVIILNGTVINLVEPDSAPANTPYLRTLLVYVFINHCTISRSSRQAYGPYFNAMLPRQSIKARSIRHVYRPLSLLRC